jgi:hypothetical protein
LRITRCQRSAGQCPSVAGWRFGSAYFADWTARISRTDAKVSASTVRPGHRTVRKVSAATLSNLGDARDAAGQPAAARDAWRQALTILDELHHPDAAHIHAKLREHGLIGAGT